MFRALSFALVVLAATSAAACSITVIDTLKRTFQDADAAFAGRVVDVGDFKATLLVTETFKGESNQRVVLDTGSTCDFGAFELGKEYLVIANRDGGDFRASLGSHTTEITAGTQSRLKLVRSRAAWWRSRPSRFAPIRAVSFMWRSLRYWLLE